MTRTAIYKVDKDSRRLRFKDKRPFTTYQVRKGQCEKCKNRIGDPYINRKGKIETTQKIDLHHWVYITILPWFGTEELCSSCHSKETQRILDSSRIPVSIDYFCLMCTKKTSSRLRWYKYQDDGHICHNCYKREFRKKKK